MSEQTGPNPDGWHRHARSLLWLRGEDVPLYDFCPICGVTPTDLIAKAPPKTTPSQ
jgi:hypothetical protein